MTNKVLKILILEDSEDDAFLIDRVLNKDHIAFTRMRVDTREEFTDAILRYSPDIILSDHSLPQFNSIEAREVCHKNDIHVPFILVTGTVSEEFGVDSMKRGADDYVLKSNLSRLPVAIRSALSRRQLEQNRGKQEETLRQQNEKLTKINNEMDLFVYSISHNLRSPLSTVLGVVNIAKLDRQKDAAAVDSYFGMIEESVLKLDLTLKNILDYSRNTRAPLEAQEVDIDNLIALAFRTLECLVDFDQVGHQITIDQHAPLFTDTYRLGVILGNLISNAIVYNDDTKAKRFVDIHFLVNPDAVTITVRDNGIGIEPAFLPDVFNMFYRATGRSKGAGLGLFIVKEMIEKLNGTITITSVPSEDTTVTIVLPNKTHCTPVTMAA